MNSFVMLLEITVHPFTGFDYRPIIIFSQLYRIWARICTKKLLSWIQQWIDPSVHGFLAQHSVFDVFTDVLLHIEHANVFQYDISGGVLDIYKRFNCVHWDPIFEILKKCGALPNLINVWQSSLKQVTRFFKTDQYISSPIKNNRGFPEGDPLSVVPTVLLGHLFAKFLK
jgi:hypothetical protein